LTRLLAADKVSGDVGYLVTTIHIAIEGS
jgi:hypothetical protein